MREIKFRAWGKITQVMVDLHKITPLALNADFQQDGVFIPFHEDIILMQYTGLKDKNGKEIYEGDLILSPNTNPYQVVWLETGCFAVKSTINIKAPTQYLWAIRNPRIIGNIYENPELLEAV